MTKNYEIFWTTSSPMTESQQTPMNTWTNLLSEKQQTAYFPCHAQPERVEATYLSEIWPTQAPHVRNIAPAQASRRHPVRAANYVDHYTQARAYYLRQDASSQARIASAFVFELSKGEHVQTRATIIWHLRNVDERLAREVAAGLAFATTSESLIVAAPVQQAVPREALYLHRPSGTNET